MEVSTLPERVSSIPGPEEVSQGIIDLTNQTFDRLAGRLAVYAADERRDRGDNGTTLTADNENVLWENGAYGKVAIRIGRRQSEEDVRQYINSDREMSDSMTRPWSSHFSLLEKSVVMTEPYEDRRYQPLGAIILLRVLRDRYPRGVIDARESLMADVRDRGQYPEEDYGERHKVGVEIIHGYSDVMAPDRLVKWKFATSLQTRFDKPDPQLQTKSTFEGMIDTFDMRSFYEPFKPVIKRTERASHVDVARMREVFELAKDIRPMVTPIARQVRRNAVFTGMAEDFFSSRRAESSAAIE